MTDPTRAWILLVDGDRRGPMEAGRDGYVTRAWSFARSDWHKVLNDPHGGPFLEQPGIYVLLGRADERGRPRAYIGQADLVRSRLSSHFADPARSWSERAFVFAGGLNRNSTAWLEAELIEQAIIANKARGVDVALENDASPRKPNLDYVDELPMAGYYQQAVLLLGLLGVTIFDLPAALPPPSPGLAPPLTGRNVFLNVGETSHNWRRWENRVNYGLMSGGGSKSIAAGMDKIRAGDRIFAYLSGHGYVGVGVALADALPVDQAIAFDMARKPVRVLDLPIAKEHLNELHIGDPVLAERVVPVLWLRTADRDGGYVEQPIFHSPQTTCTLSDRTTVTKVLGHFGLR